MEARLRPRAAARGRTARRVAGVPGLALLWISLVGCGGLGQPEREVARAVVTADRDAEVQIVTSTRFNVISFQGGPDGEPQVQFVSSDTVVQAPPWEERFDISQTRRFFIQVTAADTGSITGNLQVFIDGEQRANLTSELQETPLTNLFVQQR